MDSAFRRGVRFYGLACLAFLVPGLVGYGVASIVGWSSVAQAAIFGVGAYVCLLILILLDMFERTSITRLAWVLWGIAVAGIFAGVGCFVAADKASGSGGQVALRAVGVAVAVVASVVPVAVRVAAVRRSSVDDLARDTTPVEA